MSDNRPLPRAKYSPEFIQRVSEQTTPRSISVSGVDYTASVVLDALISTATPTRLVDRILKVEDGNTEAWLVGGMTEVQAEELSAVFLALYYIKTNNLEHLRGQDKELLLSMAVDLVNLSN